MIYATREGWWVELYRDGEDNEYTPLIWGAYTHWDDAIDVHTRNTAQLIREGEFVTQVETSKLPSTAQMHAFWTAQPPRGKYVPRPPEASIYLSEFGKCERRAVLRLLKFPSAPFSAASKAAMRKGLDWESYVQLLWVSWCNKRGLAYSRQAEIHTPFGNGKMDFWIPGANHMIEVKATDSSGKPWLPRQEHVDQLLMYLEFYTCIDPTIEPAPTMRPTAELCYAFYDTGEIVSYPVIYEQHAARVADLLAWGHRVQEGVKLGILPDRLNMPDKFPCSWRSRATGTTDYCSYFDHCYTKPPSED